jgi:small neutral amino acid transporter SnatA (MarC family)
LATVILLVSRAPERRLEWIGALALTITVCAVVLLLAERIQRLLGDRFVIAMERLMGLILVAVAVEMMVRAFQTLLG